PQRSPTVGTSQSLNERWLLPAAKVLPSGLNATEPTMLPPWRVARISPVRTSQSLTVWSSPPDANVLPSGLNATDSTGWRRPLRVAVSSPVVTSHTWTTPRCGSPLRHALPPAARVLPSGLNATEPTGPASPRRVTRRLGCWAGRGGGR